MLAARRLTMIRIACLLLAACCTAASAQTAVRVKVFPGSQNLPLIAGVSQGYFERQGLKVEVLFTQSSQEQRDGLASGDFQIAHSAVDNAVAMVERAKKDVIIVSGGDSSMNEVYVQPDVKSVADLKGRTIIVDAPNTAYALQLKKILLLNGLKAGDYKVQPIGATFLRLKALRENTEYAASTLNPPFSLEAQAAGKKSLGRVVDLIGPYQATGAFVLRDWAKASGETLERYLAALIEGTRWSVAPANRDAAAKLLVERFKVEPANAGRMVDYLADAKFGLNPDARLDLDGFRAVLALRAEIEGDWGGKAPAAERYLDLSYYDQALRRAR
jgi:ABC-type nitrate/sulfonate/bicarbonate transport system substrate-binding protein